MKNKTALITGASSGIGLELANVHAKNGGDLVIVARTVSRLNELKEKLEKKYHVNVYVIEKDLSEQGAAVDIYNQIKAAGISIDYLINNAGFGGRGYFHERNLAVDLEMMQVNMVVLTELTHLFLPEFIKSGSGRILNVSSTAGEIPGPLQAVYYATKAYVTSFSNAISEELKGTGVTVTALLPGATKTGFSDTAGMSETPAFKNMQSAVDVAKDAYDGMLKGKLNVLAGMSFSQKLSFQILPFLPKKMLLKTVFNLQSVKK